MKTITKSTLLTQKQLKGAKWETKPSQQSCGCNNGVSGHIVHTCQPPQQDRTFSMYCSTCKKTEQISKSPYTHNCKPVQQECKCQCHYTWDTKPPLCKHICKHCQPSKSSEWEHATLKNPCKCICHREGDEDECSSCKIATQSVKLALSQQQKRFKEMIGEDELVQKTDDIQEVDLSMNDAEVRNMFRAELRKKLK